MGSKQEPAQIPIIAELQQASRQKHKHAVILQCRCLVMLLQAKLIKTNQHPLLQQHLAETAVMLIRGQEPVRAQTKHALTHFPRREHKQQQSLPPLAAKPITPAVRWLLARLILPAVQIPNAARRDTQGLNIARTIQFTKII